MIGYSISEYPAQFTDSPSVPSSERCQTRVSCEQNAFPVCCLKKLRNFATKLVKQAFPKIHEEGDEVRFGSFNRLKALSFLFEFIDKTGEKVLCLQMQIKLKSCVTLFS